MQLHYLVFVLLAIYAMVLDASISPNWGGSRPIIRPIVRPIMPRPRPVPRRPYVYELL